MKSSALIGAPLLHLAFGFSLYTTVCGLVLVSFGSDANRSELYWILPLGSSAKALGVIRLICWTLSTMLPLVLLKFQVDGYLPSATTISPPALRLPLLQVSGLSAHPAYPADDV